MCKNALFHSNFNLKIERHFRCTDALKIQNKNLLNMKMVVNYLNFVFLIEVKTKCKYRTLNFVFQFIKKTKWRFGYTDLRANHSNFVTKELSKSIMNRSRLRNQFLKNRSVESRIKYSKQRNICIALLRKTKRKYYEALKLSDVNDNKVLENCQAIVWKQNQMQKSNSTC